MSLYDRLMEQPEHGGGGGGAKGRFRPAPGGALQITDRSRQGVRNKMKGGKFVGRNKRYPVSKKRGKAAALGSLSQAMQRGAVVKKVASAVRKAFPEVCPTVLSGCPGRRNHGAGGAPVSGREGPSEHGAKSNWPFYHSRKKPKWDVDWTALGHEKKSSGLKRQRSHPKRMAFKKTKGYSKAQHHDLKKQAKAAAEKEAQLKKAAKAAKKGKAGKAAKAAAKAEKAHKKLRRALKRYERRKKGAERPYRTKAQAAHGKGTSHQTI